MCCHCTWLPWWWCNVCSVFWSNISDSGESSLVLNLTLIIRPKLNCQIFAFADNYFCIRGIRSTFLNRKILIVSKIFRSKFLNSSIKFTSWKWIFLRKSMQQVEVVFKSFPELGEQSSLSGEGLWLLPETKPHLSHDPHISKFSHVWEITSHKMVIFSFYKSLKRCFKIICNVPIFTLCFTIFTWLSRSRN